MKYLLLFILVTSCAYLPTKKANRFPSSSDGKSCVELGRVILNHSPSKTLSPKSIPIEKLSSNKTYIIHFKGDTKIYRLEFLRHDDNMIVFKSGNEEFRRPVSDIHEIRYSYAFATMETSSAIKTDIDPQTEKLVNDILDTVRAFKDGFSKTAVVAGPTKKIAEVGSVKVIGKILASKKVGLELIKEVTVYDESLASLGFRIPDSTNIILNDRPIFPNSTGPYFTNFPIKVLGRGNPETTILMYPFAYRTNATRDLTILRHERAHAIFHATYSDDAFVNDSVMVQEGLADFFAAHLGHNPVIGKEAIDGRAFIRNIETREAGPFSINSLMDLTAEGHHNNSLLISNALWRVRKAVGHETMTGLIKSIVEDLNLHFKSATISGTKNFSSYARSEVQYSLASIRKTLFDKDITEGIAEIDQLAEELGITSRALVEMGHQLSRQGNFAFNGIKTPSHHVIVFHTAAGATAGAAITATGYAIYQLVPETNFFVREPKSK